MIAEALVLWMIEQIQIFGFGGSSTCSIAKSLTNFLASMLTFLTLLYFTMAGQNRKGMLQFNFRLSFLTRL